MSYAASPEGAPLPLPHHVGNNTRPSESPRPTPAPDARDRKRKQVKDSKDSDTQSVAGTGVIEAPKKEKKRRQRRAKDDSGRSDSSGVPSNMPATFKISSFSAKEGPETSSSGSRSLQPSPTSATPRPPSRIVDDDYDEGITESLLTLSHYRVAEMQAPSTDSQSGSVHSPTVSNGSRHTAASPRPSISHRGSISSSRSRPSPPGAPGSLKRPLSPTLEEMDPKRTRVDVSKRSASSPSGGRRTPVPSSQPSPIPFRTQPSHSPEARQHTESHYTTSPPQLAVVLPPHPRPIGPGHASHASPSVPIALPPIATLSPASSVPSPSDERMIVDSHRSATPPSRGKLSEVMNPAAGSPPMKSTTSPARSQERTAPTVP